MSGPDSDAELPRESRDGSPHPADSDVRSPGCRARSIPPSEPFKLARAFAPEKSSFRVEGRLSRRSLQGREPDRRRAAGSLRALDDSAPPCALRVRPSLEPLGRTSFPRSKLGGRPLAGVAPRRRGIPFPCRALKPGFGRGGAATRTQHLPTESPGPTRAAAAARVGRHQSESGRKSSDGLPLPARPDPSRNSPLTPPSPPPRPPPAGPSPDALDPAAGSSSALDRPACCRGAAAAGAEHEPPTGFACAAAAARVAGSGGAEAEWGSGRDRSRDGVTADGSRTRLIGAAEPGGVGVGGRART